MEPDQPITNTQKRGFDTMIHMVQNAKDQAAALAMAAYQAFMLRLEYRWRNRRLRKI